MSGHLSQRQQGLRVQEEFVLQFVFGLWLGNLELWDVGSERLLSGCSFHAYSHVQAWRWMGSLFLLFLSRCLSVTGGSRMDWFGVKSLRVYRKGNGTVLTGLGYWRLRRMEVAT